MSTPSRRAILRRPLTCSTFGLALLVSANTHAQTVVEPGWTLIRSISFDNPIAARVNPLDGRIYVGRRDTATDGLYRIDAQSFASLVADGTLLAGICIDPTNGAIFHSENNAGVIFRTAFGASGRTTWVSGFHSGDDDPAGMAIAPPHYRGRVIAPGSGLVADHGFNGPDEIWRWSPVAPEGETALHADNGTLVDAFDVAIGADVIYTLDTGGAGAGTIYTVGVGGALTPLATSESLAAPLGIAVDPRGEDVLVAEATTGRVLRMDPANGVLEEVITGLALGANWASLEATADGVQLVVTAAGADAILVFARCDATGHPELDCDGNGVADVCDIASGAASDCNLNGVPDSCDIASGSSVDCNGDGIPDDCPQCPPIEVVFIMDTSTSMDDEAAALCASLPQVGAALTAAGLEVTTKLLAICDQPGGAYACLDDNVANLLGTAVPGNPPRQVDTLGACPGGNEVCQEDWALATAVVAGNYPWLPKGASVRLVIPISDEGPWCGNPVNATDNLAIDQASAVAVANGVFVSPIVGTGASAAVTALAEELAAATGGQAFSSSKPAIDISDNIVELVLSACRLVPKCALGDLNCDGSVNAADLAILLGSWGGAATAADINCSGVVDAADLALLLGAWDI
ncbi:MAG: hypothetical protein SGJ11_04755 [Phycisphaerae bacterium]|nr:hypothetical protein [Phycisphaerae bacterium]